MIIKETKPIEATLWGRMAMNSRPFGQRWNNEDLISKFGKSRVAEARATISATGITDRFFYEDFLSEDEMVDLNASIGARLVRGVMEAKGWSGIDSLIDTSAILPLDFSLAVLEKLGMRNIGVKRETIRLACAGVPVGLGDVLANPDAYGEKVVILAQEPLGYLIDDALFTIDRITLAAMFGNDAGAIGFNPGDYVLYKARTSVVSDGGALSLRQMYESPKHDPRSVPRHYTLPAENDFFASDESGRYITFKRPADQSGIAMDGRKVIKYVLRQVPPVLLEVANPDWVDTNRIYHQPARQPSTGINDRLPDNLKAPFYLTEMRRSNSSSATIVALMNWLARGKLIDPDKPTYFGGPGLGGSISYVAFEPRMK